MGLAQRAAEHREILGEGEDGAAVDGAPAGDHAVARNLGLLHAELGRTVLDEHVELLERALVHQELHALARGELAALVLRLDAGGPAAGAGAGAALRELVYDVLHVSTLPCALMLRYALVMPPPADRACWWRPSYRRNPARGA